MESDKIATPFRLTAKNIIITGASSGIGRQTAISCSAMGANVLLFGRNQGRLEDTLRSIGNSKNHLKFAIDLTDVGKVTTTILELKDRVGQVHGVVNAAGISTTLPFKLNSVSKFETLYQTNVIAGFNLVRELLKHRLLSKDGASIVFISSVMGMVGEKGKTLYGMTKGAVIAGVRSLAIELADKKIRLNSVSPGVVKSPMSDEAVYSQDEVALKKIISNHPLGLGDPEDVAQACIYLLSEASGWVTGSNLVVDGGYTAR